VNDIVCCKLFCFHFKKVSFLLNRTIRWVAQHGATYVHLWSKGKWEGGGGADFWSQSVSSASARTEREMWNCISACLKIQRSQRRKHR
jgi:hypothetical protein